jgi:DNA-binding NtrC family response regulator
LSEQEKEILLAAPYEEMYQEALRIVEDGEQYKSIDVRLGNLSEGLRLAQEYSDAGYRVVISRGGTYRLIKQAGIDIPVVEIKSSPFDLIESLAFAMEQNKPLAIVGYSNIINQYDESILKRIVRTKLCIVNLKRSDDVRIVIEDCAQNGYALFLGDTIVHDVCHEAGYECFLLKSGSSAIQAAMDEALRICAGIRQERENALRARNKGFVARYTFNSIIHKSQEIDRCIKVAKKFSCYDASILLEGASGVGKELFAQSIHNASTHRDGPFVAVNCAVLPKSLVESELFGYADGTFTGGSKGGKAGYFEMANHGTLFLDEISELPLEAQAQFLRVVQEKEVLRLGDNKVIPVRVRLICATNRNLVEMARRGEFRYDLLFRINTLSIIIPPLVEHLEDIEPLVEHFLAVFGVRYSKNVDKFSSEAINYLKRYHYEGNIRELRAMIKRAVIVCESDTIQMDDLESGRWGFLQNHPTNVQEPGETAKLDHPLDLSSIEKERIRRAFRENNYSVTKTAAALGISRTTLWRKMKHDVSLP